MSIAPARMIVSALTGSTDVHQLAPPGASPHVFELRPSDARLVSSANALVYIGENLDGWAAQIAPERSIAIMDLLPANVVLLEEAHAGHSHGLNPHIWSDPLLVAGLTPSLVDALSKADSELGHTYKLRQSEFIEELHALDEELRVLMEPVAGASVIVMHPSWDYFLHRYGIKVAGVLEPSPGHEASPRDLEALIEVAKKEKVRTVLTEPQLPVGSARALADAIEVALCEIDPLGGVPGRDSYAELLRYNARVLREALQ